MVCGPDTLKPFWSICYICWKVHLLCILVKLTKFTLEQIAKKSNGQILSSQVWNKILEISASFELWYLIVAYLLLEQKTKFVRFLKITLYSRPLIYVSICSSSPFSLCIISLCFGHLASRYSDIYIVGSVHGARFFIDMDSNVGTYELLSYGDEQ